MNVTIFSAGMAVGEKCGGRQLKIIKKVVDK